MNRLNNLNTINTMRTNCTEETLRESLMEVNAQFGYDVKFNRFERIGRWIHFTLKTKSGAPGSRFSSSGRKGPWASWHVHGHLFEQIFAREEKAVIWSAGRRITEKEGNWEDRLVSPGVMFSETSIL